MFPFPSFDSQKCKKNRLFISHEKTVLTTLFLMRLSPLLLFAELPKPTIAWHHNEIGGRAHDIKEQI